VNKLPIPVTGPIPVAQYNRMSGDQQRHSIPFQQEWNLGFAARHNMAIVATYADAGKSGVTLHRRDELKRLLADVRSETTKWKAILVYDVTRWGRFQDPDEAAFYEWICKMAGYPVIYTAEPFAKDQGPFSALQKSLKRAMAGEFSRELSVKTYAGQERATKRGNWCSGNAGYGLRRAIVGSDWKPRMVLEDGQWKNIKSEATTLVLGPEVEVEAVRRIYRMFVEERISMIDIAAALNADGVPMGQPSCRSSTCLGPHSQN